VHQQAQLDDTVLRLSMDTKAAVKVGEFDRGGKTRAHLQAADHDFAADEVLTLFGIFLPSLDEVYFYLTASSVTADFIVDCVQNFWDTFGHSFPHVTTLLINLDNGPENNSRRTQFMARLTHLADRTALTIQLAYYPPYHSKYNPVERVWGVLEQHWNGHLLETRETVFQLAASMTWKGLTPVVEFIEKTYAKGVKLSKKAMALLEERLTRSPTLPKWFLHITPQRC